MMLKVRRTKIGHIGEAILVTVGVAGVVTVVALFPGVAHIIAPFVKKKRYSPKQATTHNLESLIRSGLIERKMSKNGMYMLTLTARGRWEAALRHRTFTSKERGSWDGIWRVVIFDIPNHKRKLRDELRRGMRMYGFKLLQRSVWVYPYECDDFIELLKSHLGVSNDVLYMKVSYIENQKHLKSEWSL
jgi:DNA-binding transcriptional regulator PaaX